MYLMLSRSNSEDRLRTCSTAITAANLPLALAHCGTATVSLRRSRDPGEHRRFKKFDFVVLRSIVIILWCPHNTVTARKLGTTANRAPLAKGRAKPAVQENTPKSMNLPPLSPLRV